MTIINRYLFRAIAGGTAVVLLVLVSLAGFIEFVGQLDDLGEGDYQLPQAMQYVLLRLPHLAAGLWPMSALLGTLLGLSALAAGSELIVMQTSGVSVYRLARSVALTGLLLAALGGVLGEFIAPQMDLYARQLRAVAKSGESNMAGASAWLREGNTVFNVRPTIDGIDFGGVYVFRMNESGTLDGIGRADSVESVESVEFSDAVQFDENEWRLSNYQESVFSDTGVTLRTEIDAEKISKLNDLLSITAVRESSLTARELYNYVQYLKKNGLESVRYEIAFWGRMATVIGIAVMCVLAVPFVFGSLRSTGAGARLLAGIVIGIAYFLVSRTLADSAAVFALSPFAVAWLPTVVLISATMVALSRMR